MQGEDPRTSALSLHNAEISLKWALGMHTFNPRIGPFFVSWHTLQLSFKLPKRHEIPLVWKDFLLMQHIQQWKEFMQQAFTPGGF